MRQPGWMTVTSALLRILLICSSFYWAVIAKDYAHATFSMAVAIYLKLIEGGDR